MAFEVLDSPGGKVIEIKSQEELASLAGGLDWSNNITVYIMLPASLSKEPFRGEVKHSDRPYDGRNGKKVLLQFLWFQ
jgi:hypothetical protein